MLIKEIESQSQPQDEDMGAEEEVDESEEEEMDVESVGPSDSVEKQKVPKKAKDSTTFIEEDTVKKTGEDGETDAAPSIKRIKKKQKQEYTITSASEQDLTAMFAPPGLILSSDWNTIKDPVMRDFKLDNFGYDKNNTLAIKLTAPPGSTRWSFNITPPDHFESTNILLHFNPRKGKRTELVMNDKQGTWGT